MATRDLDQVFPHRRWVPDPVIVDALIDGRIRLEDLEREDLCLVVATLRSRGESVEQIADRLRCSQRHVKRVVGDALTVALWQVAEGERRLRAVEDRAERDRRRWGRERGVLEERVGELKEQVRRSSGATLRCAAR